MTLFDVLKQLVKPPMDAVARRAYPLSRANLGLRVLIVDDSATIRAVLGKMLMPNGCEVYTAGDGELAVAMTRQVAPDVVFLDIVLPGISGFEVLRALRRDAATRALPIIMMSGNQQATEEFYVQRFGADGFIKKPFGRAEVYHSIRLLYEAGRLPERRGETPVVAIPAGMTAAEWNAIPDVALPDDAQGSIAAANVVGVLPRGWSEPVPSRGSLAERPRRSGHGAVAAPASERVKRVGVNAWLFPVATWLVRPSLGSERTPADAGSSWLVPAQPTMAAAKPVRATHAPIRLPTAALSRTP